MARKNLIGVIADTNVSDPSVSPSAGVARPLAGWAGPARTGNAVGGITKSLSNITSKMERVQDLEKQLAEGQSVVEIDPASIDASFVNDRLSLDQVELAQLVEQIREHGQQVPILVRPHPESAGRYQVAYGHRRLAAARQLGLRIKAVVRELTDDQLVVSQGQENNARTNLSYIERALFASKLEDRAFSRETIMSALGIDKAALSKMLGVVRQVPLKLIEAIGPAPEVGRRRWMEMAEKLQMSRVDELVSLLASQDAPSRSSDERFHIVMTALSRNPVRNSPSSSPASWTPEDRRVSVKLTTNAKKGVIAVEASDGIPFAEFITTQLDALYAAFRASRPSK